VDQNNPPAGPDALVNGARFIPANVAPGVAQPTYRVVFKGDFVRDQDGRGVDAQHLPRWLMNLPTDRPTGEGTEGGTFESWFRIGTS
jgi:hypothetical protein